MATRPGPPDPALAAWCVGVAAFQGGLALGAPWGAAAWGGTHAGVLPARLRAASAVAAVAWAATAAVIGDGRFVGPATRRRVVNGVTAFAGVGVVANTASRSPVERAVWVPLTLVGAGLGVRARRQSA